MLTEHLKTLETFTVISLQPDQTLVTGPGDLQRGILLRVVELDRIKRIDILFRRQLARQKFRIHGKVGKPLVLLLAAIVSHGAMLREAFQGSAHRSWSQHVTGEPDAGTHGHQSQGEQKNNQSR